jgi:hypothetical protein
MEPIRTTSGKTARAQIAALRQKRIVAQADPSEALIVQLDALADQAYATIRAMREQGNLLRLLAVDAKRTVLELRKGRKVDVEL